MATLLCQLKKKINGRRRRHRAAERPRQVRRSRARRRRPILDVHDVKQPGSIGAAFLPAPAQRRAPVANPCSRAWSRAARTRRSLRRLPSGRVMCRERAREAAGAPQRVEDARIRAVGASKTRVNALMAPALRSSGVLLILWAISPSCRFRRRVWPCRRATLVTSALVRASVCTRWNHRTALPRAHAANRSVAIATARRRYWRRDMTVSKSSVPRFAHAAARVGRGVWQIKWAKSRSC